MGFSLGFNFSSKFTIAFEHLVPRSDKASWMTYLVISVLSGGKCLIGSLLMSTNL